MSFNTALSGLNAAQADLAVTSNNIANVNTTGFKDQRTNFEDLLYIEKAQPGVENANGDGRPSGIYVGLGTKVANTDFDFTQGSPVQTGRFAPSTATSPWPTRSSTSPC